MGKFSVSKESVLENTKWEIFEDSWNFIIMGCFWSLLSKTKCDFERQSWNIKVSIVKSAVEYKASHEVGVSKFQYK